MLYSNEIVFRGHPDKVCDQISDRLLDEYLEHDPMTRAGIECVGGKGKIFITGEVTSTYHADVEKVVKSVLKDVGYRTDYEIINNLGIQSPDISMGVDVGGAGDQGMMFGYATRDTEEYLPVAQIILQKFSHEYENLRHGFPDDFYPDGKAQITGIYDKDFNLLRIKTFTISYQNSENHRESTDKIIRNVASNICSKYGIKVDEFLINPTGKFLIGGFDGDSGLTGRKIVIDNYHSFANVGGGAFSGKDPTKVDRSAAYKARQIAIRILNQNPQYRSCEVQISYAIGKLEPLSIFAKADGSKIFNVSDNLYKECIPGNIINEFNLRTPVYYKTAQFGHFGNKEFPWELRRS